jgi:FdhE protein
MALAASSSWERRIDRAMSLAEHDEAGRPLLLTYGRLLGLQRDCYDALRRSAGQLTGALERDGVIVRSSAPPILRAMVSTGPAVVAEQAAQVLAAGHLAIDALLCSGWQAVSPQPFLARLVLQPYFELLTMVGARPADRTCAPAGWTHCPFCGGAPQLSILHSRGEGDGGGRQLLCSSCSTTWPVGRIRCAYCGEENEGLLAYYRSPNFDHLRVDACDTCRHYLKTVDLTRLGKAVPLVDEVAGAPLDLWAREQGYEKVELNLVGL